MKDRYGTDIDVGDIVCTSQRAGPNGIPAGVLLGLVVGMTNTKIRVDHAVLDETACKNVLNYNDRLIDPMHVVVFQKCENVKKNDTMKT